MDKSIKKKSGTSWCAFILSSKDITNCLHVSTSGILPVFSDFVTAWQYLNFEDTVSGGKHRKKHVQVAKCQQKLVLFKKIEDN